MKYIFFMKGGFQRSETVWYICDGPNKPLYRRTQKRGVVPSKVWTFADCMAMVNCGLWQMRQHQG
jgi:ribosomal protein L15